VGEGHEARRRAAGDDLVPAPGRSAADARHHAGTADRHVARYRGLVDAGVCTVFVAPPDLAGPDDVGRWAPVLTALSPRER